MQTMLRRAREMNRGAYDVFHDLTSRSFRVVILPLRRPMFIAAALLSTIVVHGCGTDAPTTVVLTPPVPAVPLEIHLSAATVLVARTISATASGTASGVVWASDNPHVASVSPSGVISGLYPGQAHISATRGEAVASVTITVNVARIDVPAGDIIVELSGKRTLEAIVRDADNVELEGVQVNWSSEHAEIATVEAETGVVTGVSRGRTAVFASVGPVNGQVAVLVTSSPDRELELSTVGFGNHICGLQAGSGLAFCWGDNHAGALGVGVRDGSDVPLPVSGGHRFSMLSVGFYANCGVEVGTAVAYCWGSNSEGDLGIGHIGTIWEPSPVANGTIRFASISASGVNTCGVELDTGYGYCWGAPVAVGDGTLERRLSPVRVFGNLRFSSISTSGFHACGIEANTGRAFCWGGNGVGELGDGTQLPRAVPTPVAGNIRFTAIDAGWHTTCGVERDTGRGYCWGSNEDGQIGDGSKTDRLVPTPVTGGHQFSVIEVAVMTCGLELHTGVAVCWGRDIPTPTVVGNAGTRFSAMVAGYGNAFAIEVSTGRLYYWWFGSLEPHYERTPWLVP